MKTSVRVAIAASAMLCVLASSAMAQPNPVLEIDFTSATLPLSPLLTLLIAVVIGGCGLLALHRMRGRARHAIWMILGIASLPIIGTLSHEHAIGIAQANPYIPLSLQTSPATIGVIYPGTFQATNMTSGNISLIAVKLDNAGPLTVNPESTCVAGLPLAPGASCLVSVTEN